MRIATWNVNSIRARLKFVLHWLEARQPDVVCLQELKVTEDTFPYSELEELGYHACVEAQPRWNGVAVIAKTPPELIQAGLPAVRDQGARLVMAKVGDLHVASAYVPNGKTVSHEDYPRKLAWLAALDEYVAELDLGDKVVIGGDFNVAPEPSDSFAPNDETSIFHTAAERSAIARLRERGLHDLYRTRNPDGDMFSWWDYRAGHFHKNVGLRIDLLLASASVLASTGEVWIDRDYRKKQDGETPSDHAPVIAELS